jgi:hypothetical protein
MSNTVDNTLIVFGKDRESVMRFVADDELHGRVFDFDRVIFVGDDFPAREGTPPGDGEYDRVEQMIDARIAAWGCKTHGEITRIQEVKSKIIISFGTAWSPPLGVVRRLIETHPHLKMVLYYEDDLAGFRGVLSGKDGAVTKETHKEGKKAF